MRNRLLFLAVSAVVLLAVILLLPVLGLLFLALAGLLALLVAAFLAAPLLAKLPWFRKRIVVEQYGSHRIIRFGRDSSQGRRHAEQSDVLDADFRELPDEEKES